MKFVFVITATISLATEVEASTLEEAVAIARSRSAQKLCHQCTDRSPQESWCVGGELDCELGAADLVDLHCRGDGEKPSFEAALALWPMESP